MSKSLSERDLVRYRELSIQKFNDLPAHAQLAGMRRDLTIEEKRQVAHFEAAVIMLNQMALLVPGAASTVIQTSVPDYQVIEGEAAVATQNVKKRR